MATPIQQLKGTAAEVAAKVYAQGLLVWNETAKRWHGGDGVPVGGIAMARYDERNDGALGYEQRVETAASNSVTVADIGKAIIGNRASAIAFNLAAAATLTSKFVAVFKNINAGPMTIVPNGAELIDGVNAAITVPNGSSVVIKGDGTSFRTFLSNGDLPALGITNDKIANATLTSAKLSAAALSDLKWLSKAIGEFYYADDGVTGVDIPPTTSSLFRFVELTAGLTGVGQYNEGCLASESVSGSAPLVLASAQISLAGSPMNGQTIRLLNTERRMLRAGSAGTLQNDALQNVTGTLIGGQESFTGTGVFSTGAAQTAIRPNNGSASVAAANFSLAGDANARTDTETRMKNIGVRVFRRIK